MSTKPILFNTEMVLGLLDGRKTVTRRVMKPQPLFYTGRRYVFADEVCPKKWEDCDDIIDTYQYQPGDILYVRERFAYLFGRYVYRADYDKVTEESKPFWKPSIHMPKEAARILLRVKNVRVERLQEISEEQAKAEGAEPAFEYNTMDGPVITFDEDGYFYYGFKALWNSLYAKPMPVKEHGKVIRYESIARR